MKEIQQNYRDGSIQLVDVPPPAIAGPGVIVRTTASVVSAGTERLIAEFAGKSLIGKARARPDLVKQVREKLRRDGLRATLQAVFARLDKPLPLGYSAAGRVIDSSDAGDLRAGDRVACAGATYACHAEIIFVPRHLAARIPDAVSDRDAAFATLGAIALQSIRVADLRIGETVGVIGLGPIGLLAVQLAEAAGARVIAADLDPARVALAREIGADASVSANEFADAAAAFSAGRGLDGVIVAASTESDAPIRVAGEVSRKKGRVVAVGAVGLDVPRRIYYEKELALLLSTSYGPGRYDPSYEEKGQDYPHPYVPWTEGRNLSCFLDLLARGRIRVDRLVSHEFPLERHDEAYALVRGEREEPSLGIVLRYGDDEAPASPSVIVRRASPPAPGTIGIGAIGAGLFAQSVVFPILRSLPGARLVAVASATGRSARHAAERFGFARATSDADAILSDDSIDAVLVATRHDTHASLAARALDAGKHVFIEKPVALDEDGLAMLQEAIARHPDRVVAVGFNRRFAPLARRVERALAGRNGPICVDYLVNAGAIPPDHWTQDPAIGGGRIVGEGCHFIDFIRWLADSPIVRVHAVSARCDRIDRIDADHATILCELADGSIGSLSYWANGDRRHAKEDVRIFCDGMVAAFEDFRRGRIFRDGNVEKIAGDGKGHRQIWEAFLRAIAEGGEPPVDLAAAFEVTRATFAALRSLSLGLPIDLREQDVCRRGDEDAGTGGP